MNVVAHNLSSMFTNRELGVVTDRKIKSTEKLSSGYKINRAADDAAGLSISEKMRRQIRGLKQGSDNMEDGVSLCQTADGYLEEVIAMLHRMNELSIKAANGTNSASDRMDIDNEIQELKEETNRIFRTARFNEVRIFEMPYVPAPYIDKIYEKDNDIHDIQVFSVGMDGSDILYGGIELSNIRHTWDELGIAISADGKTFAEDKVIDDFKDSNGEKVELYVKKGDPLSSITRRNYWSAKDDGIYVNDVLAATWDQVKSVDGSQAGIQDKANYGEFEFRYRNQVISFQVNDGDNKQDVIDGINGRGLNTKYSWDTYVDDEVREPEKALSNLKANTIQVTDSNKNALDSTFTIKTTQTGVTVNSSGSGDLTTMSWGNQAVDFTDGTYPIADWGLSDVDGAGLNSTTKTFDDSVTYTYKNTTGTDLGIEFSFKLADEAGYEQVENALNGVELKKTFYAPGTMQGSTTASSNGGRPKFTFTYSGSSAEQLSYQVQKEYGRKFNDQYDEMTGTVSRVLNSDYVPVGTPDQETIPGSNRTVTNPSEDKGYVYIKQDDGTYLRANKTVTDKTHTQTKTVSTYTTYNGYYTYQGNFGSNALTEKRGNDFTFEKKVAESMKLVEDIKQNVYEYDYSHYYTDQEIDDAGLRDKVEIADTSEHKTGDWQITGSATSWRSYGTGDTIVLEAAGKGQIGTVTFDDRTTGFLTASPLGNATVNLKYNATDYAYATFNAKENSFRNVSDPIRLHGLNINIPMKELPIQVSAKNPDHINLQWSGLNNGIIGIKGTNTKTIEDARYAIDDISNAIKIVSDTRSIFGAQQNRLEHSIKLNDNTAENTQYAESVIRDTDMAAEMVKFSKESILQQAGQAMLTQASKEPERILQLLS